MPSHPTTQAGLDLVAVAVALDLGQDAVGMGREPDQPRRSVHLAALFVEVVGQDGLGDLLGHAEIEPVATSAVREVERSEHLASGVDLRASLWRPSLEEPFDESQRLEDLERARMHHRRPVPMKRPRPRIDQLARHTAPIKLRSQE